MKKLIALLFIVGCSALSMFSPKPSLPVNRPIQYLAGSSFDGTITNGLSAQDRMIAYNMDYGIQYLPTNVLLSLKRPTNDSIPTVMDEMFFDHSERFGLLPNYINPNNQLPIGITSSIDPAYAPMSGVNCFTCHTSLISNTEGKFFLVDGGASRFQIDVFLGDMLKSVVATLLNPVEFESFYARYQIRAGISDSTALDNNSQSLSTSIKTSLSSSDTTELETKLQSSAPHQSGKTTTLTDGAYPTVQQLSTRTGMYVYLTRRFLYLFSLAKYGTNPSGSTVAASGPGRSNPWAPTKNMIADKYLHSKNTYKVPGGPVNTPFVWDYNKQHWIFLLGNTNSMVERNMAQALALLSSFNPTTFETTASIVRLGVISDYMQKVKAPIWPENILGPINQTLALQGQDIFKSQCLTCHDPKLSDTTTASATYNYLDVNTDGNYYFGQIEKLDNKDLFNDVIAPFMTKVKMAAYKNENITQSTFEEGRMPAVWKGPDGNKLIAKPLFGAWATPPYLHNGSVPTIRDLLTKASLRPTQFTIGSFVYNSKDLGYIDSPSLQDSWGFVYKVYCANCDGNSNSGHEYGIELSDSDKDALIEFLKFYSADVVFN